MNGKVKLQCYEQKFAMTIGNYFLEEKQQQYTATPVEALQACVQDPGRHPVLILYGNCLVGFFVLHGWGGVKKYSDNKNAILLRAYSIDSRQQGKGFAKQSLSLLDDFVKKYFPGKDEVVLAVNHGNVRAQKLYNANGFRDSGRRVMGKKGEQLVYYRKI
ncbi:GNAT family N-acetyltransferase [Virgibacillus siamensis]|uniref:GNAT family N-acetyltransferase n=1 Tax=Virgibacillus siamensis TaxID=480071 RepID=UPI000985E990|nr:GNAT family N-acetyltransferase [Virgibacillus siamensis]